MNRQKLTIVLTVQEFDAMMKAAETVINGRMLHPSITQPLSVAVARLNRQPPQPATGHGEAATGQPMPFCDGFIVDSLERISGVDAPLRVAIRGSRGIPLNCEPAAVAELRQELAATETPSLSAAERKRSIDANIGGFIRRHYPAYAPAAEAEAG